MNDAKNYADFAEAFQAGLAAWGEGQRAQKEVHDVLESLCKQLQGSDNLKFRRKMQTVEVLGTTRPDWVDLFSVEVPIDGYPVTVRVGSSLPTIILSQVCACSDREAVERALMRLLSSPYTGELFSTIRQ